MFLTHENGSMTPTHMRTPKLLDRFNCKSKGENNRRKKSWGTLPNS